MGSDSAALGSDLITGQRVSLTGADLARHAYILGSTGCGKTTLILKLFGNDLAAGHSAVILDLRGDLIQGALALCAAKGIPQERVTLLDLRERRGTTSFNPLAGAGEPYIRALHVLEVVAAEADSWGVQLEETMRSALLLLSHAKQPLTMIESVFYDDTFRRTCLRLVDDESLIAFWERYERFSEEKRHGLALPVLNKITPLLAVPALRAVLAGEYDLNLGRLLATRGHVLLVSLAVDEFHRSSRMLGSLLVSAVSREMMARVNVPERNRNPVRLYIDEFENMASQSFESLIAEGRRFGLTLVLSHQTLSQLPARLRSVVRNNVGVQIVFQCGFEDAALIARELEDLDTADIRSLRIGQAVMMQRDGSTRSVQFDPPNSLATSQTQAYRDKLLSSIPPRKPRVVREIEAMTPPERKGRLDDWL